MNAAGAAADIATTMSAAAQPHTRSQVPPSLLVEHVIRRDPGDRPTAAARLERQLGPELATLLVSALAGDHRVRRLCLCI
jgi:hypothetical protein